MQTKGRENPNQKKVKIEKKKKRPTIIVTRRSIVICCNLVENSINFSAFQYHFHVVLYVSMGDKMSFRVIHSNT